MELERFIFIVNNEIEKTYLSLALYLINFGIRNKSELKELDYEGKIQIKQILFF